MTYTRRDVCRMSLAALPAAGLLAAADRLWAAKPDSVLGGVRIGTIAPYSFHNLPDDAPSVLQDLLTDNLSGCELQHYCAEQFAGAPAAAPLARGGRGGRRAPLTPAQRAARAEAAAQLQAWRLSVSMDKFKQLRQLYN